MDRVAPAPKCLPSESHRWRELEKAHRSWVWGWQRCTYILGVWLGHQKGCFDDCTPVQWYLHDVWVPLPPLQKADSVTCSYCRILAKQNKMRVQAQTRADSKEPLSTGRCCYCILPSGPRGCMSSSSWLTALQASTGTDFEKNMSRGKESRHFLNVDKFCRVFFFNIYQPP